MFEEQTPWDSPALVANRIESAANVLDMGAGGGERLLKLRPHWPPNGVSGVNLAWENPVVESATREF